MPRSQRGVSGNTTQRCPAIYFQQHHYILWSVTPYTTRSGGVLRECSYTGVSRQPLARAIPRIARGFSCQPGKTADKPVEFEGRGKQKGLYRTVPGTRKPGRNQDFADPPPGTRVSAFDRLNPPEETSVTEVGKSPVSRRIARMSNIAAEWRWVIFLSICVLGVVVVSIARRRRRPSIASMPSSFFRRRQPATHTPESEEPHGPEGGRVIRLDDQPSPLPAGAVLSSDEHPFPPIGEIGAHQPPPPPPSDGLLVTIDLTELEDEPETVGVSVESEMAALPADPWG